MMAIPALPDDIEWRIEPGLLDYAAALTDMDARAEGIAAGTRRERIWLVEHPPLYTAGTRAQAAAANIPITAPASASSIPASTSPGAGAMSAGSSRRLKAG